MEDKERTVIDASVLKLENNVDERGKLCLDSYKQGKPMSYLVYISYNNAESRCWLVATHLPVLCSILLFHENNIIESRVIQPSFITNLCRRMAAEWRE